MCFGSKSDAGGGEAPRPAQTQPPSATEQKRASVPSQYQQPQYQQPQYAQPQYAPQQQQQQQQQPPQQPPFQQEYASPMGPPPSQQPPVNSPGGDFAPPMGPPPGQRPMVAPGGDDFAPPPGPPPSQGPPAGDFAPPPGPPPSQGPAGDDFAPPPGPPPGHGAPAGNDFAPPAGPPPGQRPPGDDFAPPPGPPPGHAGFAGQDFAPPPGPPPSHRAQDDMSYMVPPPGPPPSHAQNDLGYMAPPPGPPPSHAQHDLGYMAPPPGPPPSHAQNDLGYMAPPPGPPPANKPKHDWEAVVPDTSLFPPPPSFFSGFDRSPAGNATEIEAEAGERWCAEHPLTAPITLDGHAITALNTHNPRLMQPDMFHGTLTCTAPGVWSCSTDAHAYDSTILAYPPLYTVTLHSPLAPTNPTRSKTIYYEVQLTHANPPHDICLALGFTALPYPSFRMPGWHRGSVGVHGDDGHKFINDRWGGKAFTAPFAPGERLGVGMVFREAAGRIDTDVFFTRQGQEVGRWNLHEETDAEQDLPVTGLEGYHDLSCAIGTNGRTGFEVVFDPARWAYRPVGY